MPPLVFDKILSGSSPHTRGTFRAMFPDPTGCRFIPAHTGNITTLSPCSLPISVHPRTHGEHPLPREGSRVDRGSSPHTRGTFSGLHNELSIVRFIPAHTGNISVLSAAPPEAAVHPRTHGEHTTTMSLCFIFGSSPHTRGTCKVGNLYPRLVRFIPAHTGNIAELD